MANVYVRSGAGGAGTGADWANAYTTLAAAFAAKAAGDDFWVSEDHAETQASAMTLNCPGTLASPCRVICVDHAGSVPPVAADLATTATISTTGNNALTIGTGYTYCYGITFQCGSGAVSPTLQVGASSHSWLLDKCNLSLVGTGASVIQLGATVNVALLEWKDVKLKFGAVGQYIQDADANWHWYGSGSAVDSTGSSPTRLFASASNNRLEVPALIEDVDLSHLDSGKTIVAASQRSPALLFRGCKLGASVTKAEAPTVPGGRVKFVRCDSGNVNYGDEEYAYEGTLTPETTIVRTGGATDGTTSFSAKIVTTANSKFTLPFTTQFAIRNETVGSSVTVTVEGIWGSGAVPNNDEIWIEVHYPSSASNPQTAIASSGKANGLATASACSSSASTWGGSTTAFKMSATFTPQQKGPLMIVVKAAKASSTFYIDPKPVLS